MVPKPHPEDEPASAGATTPPTSRIPPPNNAPGLSLVPEAASAAVKTPTPPEFESSSSIAPPPVGEWDASEERTQNVDVPQNLSELLDSTGTAKRRQTREIQVAAPGVDDLVEALLGAMRGLGHHPREISDGELRYVILGKPPGRCSDDLDVALAMRPGTRPQPCVVRSLPLEQEAERELRRFRLRAEAHIGMALDHPNVVRVYGFGESGRTPFICRELVDGLSLRQLVLRSGTSGLSLQATLAIAIDVASTLADVHGLTKPDGTSFHVVHGELCPENILVTRGGIAKLTELSVAELVGRALRAPTEARAGQPGYMAPEQCFGQPIDRRTDMFALGLVLLELLSGETMVKMTPAQLGALAGTIVERCNSRHRVPAELSGLIMKLTSLTPAERPADMRVVADALKALEPTIGQWTRRHQEMHSLLHTSTRRTAAHKAVLDGGPANDGTPVPQVGVIGSQASMPVGFDTDQGPAAATDRSPAAKVEQPAAKVEQPAAKADLEPPADTARSEAAEIVRDDAPKTDRSPAATGAARATRPADAEPPDDVMKAALAKAAMIKEAAAKAASAHDSDDNRHTQPIALEDGQKLGSGEFPGLISTPAAGAPAALAPSIGLPKFTGSRPAFTRGGSLPKSLPDNLPSPGDLPQWKEKSKSDKSRSPRKHKIEGRPAAEFGMPVARSADRTVSPIRSEVDAIIGPAGDEAWLEPESVVLSGEHSVAKIGPQDLDETEAKDSAEERNPFSGPGGGSEFTFLDDDDDSELGSAPLILRAALYGEHAGKMPTLDALEGVAKSSAELSKMEGLLPLEDEAVETAGPVEEDTRASVSIAEPAIPLSEDRDDDIERAAKNTKLLLIAVAGLLMAAGGYAVAWFMLQ